MSTSPARIAALSGAAFTLLFVAALVLLHRAPHLDAPDAVYVAFYAHDDQLALVAVGLYLVPLAGVAFLWHMTAMRAVLDTLAPRPAAMAHGLNLLGGVVFVTMVFAGSAAVGAVALSAHLGGPAAVDPDVARSLTAVGYGLVFVFGVRGAGMFATTTTTLLRAGGVLPRRWAVVGYALAAFLLLTATTNPAAALVFPAWVVLVAVALLVHDRRGPAARPRPETESHEGTVR